jgi:hypothetical protein
MWKRREEATPDRLAQAAALSLAIFVHISGSVRHRERVCGIANWDGDSRLGTGGESLPKCSKTAVFIVDELDVE